MSCDILDVIRRKVPLLTLLIQIFIVNIFYIECIGSNDYKLGTLIYFPILCVFCLIWEIIYTLKIFARVYSHKTLRSRLIFGIFSAILCVCMFCTTSFYIESGKPFSCVFEYNHHVASILFYTNIALVLIFSVFEHYKWGL